MPVPVPAAPDGKWHVGEIVDPITHTGTGTPVVLDPASFTTHGVIVGQTGSGKTGLGIGLIEEALLAGVPALVLDPKGDLTNLLLTFPALSPDDFAPWLDDPAQAPAVAQQWRDGLGAWGIGGPRIAALRDRAAFTIYTPGSTAGVPLNLVGSLRAPANAAHDEEARTDEIGGVVAGILALVGVESDPLAGRETILLSNLLDRAWSQGQDLDLATLVAQVADPPLRKLGVLDLETFYPARDRTALALKLNGLLASPAFGAWAEGDPLDLEAMLWRDGRPACAVVELAHLSDEERQFAVTLILGRLITWMRNQPGTPNLRVLVYFDEVFGFVPPTAAPPSKRPVLTLLKQARAFGVGVVLATQNPVDVDYKALSNAATWMVGRLQTERDRDRLLDGMRSAAGGVDIDALAATISGLAKREFVLHRAGSPRPDVLTTRWTMSYLRGPLTRDQIGRLVRSAAGSGGGGSHASAQSAGGPGASTAHSRSDVPAATPSPTAVATAPVLADDETTVAPPAAAGIPVFHVAPSAPWLDRVNGVAGGRVLQAAVIARLRLLYDDEKAGLRHTEEWEAIYTPVTEQFDPASGLAVDYDDRDLRNEPAAGAASVYRLPLADLTRAAWWRDVEKSVKDHLLGHRTMTIPRNQGLKMWARPEETAEAFAARCATVADMKADEDAAALRQKWTARIERVRSALEDAERRADEAAAAKRDSRRDELLSGAGDLLSVFLGGKRKARSMSRVIKGASSRRSSASRADAREQAANEAALEKQGELLRLETELTDALFEIDVRWDERAKAIDEAHVPLERSDITVLQLGLVWIPVA